MIDVLVIGAGPAGIFAALRAADLGAKTTLLTNQEFGGMAANDGPVPVRVLAHAARLMRDAGQLDRYGVKVGKPFLDYRRLLSRVSEVLGEVRAQAGWHDQLRRLGVNLIEHAGKARFINAHIVETPDGKRYEAQKIILCAGGTSRRLPIPGFELTSTHSDAWDLKSVPESMLVIGAGATGAQVASIFNAFGCKVQLFEAGSRILPTEDEEVSAVMASAFRDSGIEVHEQFGSIDSFEKTSTGIRMNYSKDDRHSSTEAALAVVAVGWVADAASLNLVAAGIQTTSRGYVQVDPYLRTSVSHIFSAGDITGRLMLTPQAIQDGIVAGTNAVRGTAMTIPNSPSPIGSFTDPEYAQVGITEKKARETYQVVTAREDFRANVRSIIDDHKVGFCKLIADRASHKILGCHVVGERAVEIVQLVGVALAAEMTVDRLAQIPMSFPTNAGIVSRAALNIVRQLNLKLEWQPGELLGESRGLLSKKIQLQPAAVCGPTPTE